jgi:hypothetical protein
VCGHQTAGALQLPWVSRFKTILKGMAEQPVMPFIIFIG